ncbi:SDR family NAD(P)-dependent oxidoreductase [Paraburkholderia sp. CNPSo 3274]|uniref:SDR family NAD(P)-dependent oxidoreductase n=1 Tax=Paraburkholderia sp. CNPSo 3274 TaxID=2940932 RepID=UPI00265D8B87|nr:SDR family oxidoreductase [Paraburkholderia sp. CNPSo 3274]
MSKRLEGRIALIMGAGSSQEDNGVSNGQAVALTFAREGATIVAVDLSLAAAEKTAGLVREQGGTSIAIAADVSRSEDVKQVVEQTTGKYGRIDILHNNVGIEYLGGPVDTPESEWDRVHAVNLKSVFLACKHVIPHMEAQGGGSIINVSSTASLRASTETFLSYSSSKAAVNHVTRVIAAQYARKQIRCNAVIPGMMATPHVRTLYRHLDDDQFKEVMARRDASCPMGRQGSPWDVANASLFLASDEASYVTGLLLTVDGGRSI